MPEPKTPKVQRSDSSTGRPAVVAGFASGIWVVVKREMGAYFDSPIAYIYATVFLVLSSTTFMNSFFLDSIVDMSAYFDLLPFLLIPFVPAMTMRTWAEEHAQHTFELLMTLPLRSLQVVLGKYAAALLFYLLILAGTTPIVIMLVWLGSPDLGLIFSSYLGALFLGAFFLSFGLFLSGLTHNQIVAFVLATLMGFAFVVSGHEKVVAVLDGLSPGWQLGTWLFESLSVMPHYESFTRGVLGLGSALYFLLMIGFFVWMNEVTLRRNRF
jgi:ABC-2 type transport system permease protein